jgi:hypothetical protein
VSAILRPLAHSETALVIAFCDHYGDDPQAWSKRTRRQLRKALAHCRKCARHGGAS